MSAVQNSSVRAVPRRAPAPTPAGSPRPRLRVVRAPSQTRTRVPFVLLCMAILVSALLGALILNTSMAQGEYERFDLQTRLAQAAESQQQMRSQLETAAAPSQLAAAAAALGMVPSTTGGYLRLSDGAVLGAPTPAQAGG
jgi:hypothetical protein